MQYSFLIAALAAVALARPLKHTGAIRQHNLYRKQHSAPPMKWDTNLEAEAKAWTDQCNWSHHT